jgi:hypothetical protein
MVGIYEVIFFLKTMHVGLGIFVILKEHEGSLLIQYVLTYSTKQIVTSIGFLGGHTALSIRD